MADSECRVGGKHEMTKLERATRDKEDHLATTTRCLLRWVPCSLALSHPTCSCLAFSKRAEGGGIDR